MIFRGTEKGKEREREREEKREKQRSTWSIKETTCSWDATCMTFKEMLISQVQYHSKSSEKRFHA